jgi:hypothetical protein
LAGCSGSAYTSNQISIADINQTTQNAFYITAAPAASACKEALVDVSWVIPGSTLRNVISSNTLTKLTGNGNWDGNGFSYQSVSNNGYMQTTVAETNRDRMIGLSATDANASFTSIQYAFFLQNGGGLLIYESGVDRGAFGTYTSGDILKIAVENNVVKYYRNGTVIFISSVVPTLPLFVDVSTNSTGATANNVKIANGFNSTFTAVGSNLGTAPTYQWKLNGANVGTNSTTYTNISLSNADVITCVVTPDLAGCSGSAYTSNQITIADINQTTQNSFYITGTAASNTCKASRLTFSISMVSTSTCRPKAITASWSRISPRTNR